MSDCKTVKVIVSTQETIVKPVVREVKVIPASQENIVKPVVRDVKVITTDKQTIVQPEVREIKILRNGNYVFNLANNTDLFYLASEVLPVNTPLILNNSEQLEVAKASNLNHAFRFIGLNLVSTQINAIATVRNYGTVTNNNWSWELNKPIFLGINGDLTQIIDNGIKFLLQIAKPITDKTILIIQDNPILY